jgi:hypothetical protein
MKAWLIIGIVFLTACTDKKKPQQQTNPYTAILQQADSVDVGYVWGTRDSIRVTSIHEKDKRMFDELNKELGEEEERCSCEASGFMHVYVKDSVRLSLKFATANSGVKKDCVFVIVKDEDKPARCYRLTYKMGMYLDELYHDITTN